MAATNAREIEIPGWGLLLVASDSGATPDGFYDAGFMGFVSKETVAAWIKHNSENLSADRLATMIGGGGSPTRSMSEGLGGA